MNKNINPATRIIIPVLLILFSCSFSACAQPLHQRGNYTNQDSLRGTITTERAWWDVSNYNIYVAPDYRSKTIRGWNNIGFNVTKEGKNKVMQIDLQEPMQIDSIIFRGKKIKNYSRNGNIYLIDFGNEKFSALGNTGTNKSGEGQESVRLYFHGKPTEAVTPPWDGGWIWARDSKGRPWMTVACQGLGASVWYPCKDHQSDEPDNGAVFQVEVADTLVAVANGRLSSKKSLNNGNSVYSWTVTSPINNYNIVPYIGKYVHWSDSFIGEDKKELSLDYWVLDYNLEKSKKQFGRDVKPMLKAFEHWFGPYPFYSDGFKLVESSHLGMEHQSAIAYGNLYKDGYLGRDLSGTGWGMKWDYIIIHEAGHEWFGNNITTRDIADMWVHEGFTMYSEVLFIEYHFGKSGAAEYLRGLRENISNDIPLIGPYGVNREGSSDMYNKGANLIHTIRQVINDDDLFREILRGMNKDFYHRTITSADVEEYFNKKSGKDFSKVFDQYLRTTKIPELQYRISGDNFYYRWWNTVEGFSMPLKTTTGQWLTPVTEWKHIAMTEDFVKGGFAPDPDFYITVKQVNN